MGAEVGQLALRDRPCWRSVSADGTWVASVPLSSLPYPVGGGHPLILFADDPLSTRTLRFKGLCASQVAASSKAAHVALVAVLDKAGTLRLLVLNSATDEVENDVTELVTR